MVPFVQMIDERHRLFDLDIPTAAKWFAGLSDDEMAKFFCMCAEELKLRPRSFIWWLVGHHLATCECSTEAGRDMIRWLAQSMDQNLAWRTTE